MLNKILAYYQGFRPPPAPICVNIRTSHQECDEKQAGEQQKDEQRKRVVKPVCVGKREDVVKRVWDHPKAYQRWGWGE